jgi:hypothetical protein
MVVLYSFSCCILWYWWGKQLYLEWRMVIPHFCIWICSHFTPNILRNVLKLHNCTFLWYNLMMCEHELWKETLIMNISKVHTTGCLYSGAGTNTKPWKDHRNKRNKREKLRRVYAYLDQWHSLVRSVWWNMQVHRCTSLLEKLLSCK